MLKSPSTLAGAWLLAPALVVIASAGLGWGLARLTGMRLGVLLLPTGYLAAIVVVTLSLQAGLSGKAAVAVLVVAALAGLLVPAWLDRARVPTVGRPSPGVLWAAAAGLAGFAAGMAPVAGSGRSVVLGYVLNNDSAAHMAAVELIKSGGAEPTAAPYDSFHIVAGNLGVGYPLGSYVWPLFSSLGTGVDVFHVWSPMAAVAIGMLALAGFGILRRLEAPAPLAVAGAVLASVGYLLYSYHVQGGLKEVTMALAAVAVVALVARPIEEGLGWRSFLPAAVAGCAAVNVFTVAAAAWLIPAAAGGIAALLLLAPPRPGRRLRAAGAAGVGAATAGALAAPTIASGIKFVEESATEVINDVGEVGNLLAPVPWYESFNVWLIEDYRFTYTHHDVLTGIGIAAAAVLVLIGLLASLRARRVAIPLALLVGFGGVLIVLKRRQGIYLDAKAYPVLAPMIGLTAAAGMAWLYRLGGARRAAGLLLGLVLAIGVVWSDVLVYGAVWHTPKERFEELMQINGDFRGQGPVLVHDREEYAKYLLRDTEPWEPWGVYVDATGFHAGGPPGPPHTPDFDDYVLGYLDRFRLLLERKRPGGSLPPGGYEVVYETAHYRMWRRDGPLPRAHVPLGVDDVDGMGPLDCRRREVASLLRRAEVENRSVRVAHGDRVVTSLDGDWQILGGAARPGPLPNFTWRLEGIGAIPTELPTGRYQVWAQGSFGPGIRLLHKGRTVGEVRSDMGIHDGYQLVGSASVRGPFQVFIYLGVGKPWWQAGHRRENLVGPIAFVREPSSKRIEEMDATRARSLCGKELDWIELS